MTRKIVAKFQLEAYNYQAIDRVSLSYELQRSGKPP